MAYQLAFIEGDYVAPDGTIMFDIEISLVAEHRVISELKKFNDAVWMAHVMMLDASMENIIGKLFRRIGLTKKFVGKMNGGFCSFEIECIGENKLSIISFNKDESVDEYLDAINEGLDLIKYEDVIEA